MNERKQSKVPVYIVGSIVFVFFVIGIISTISFFSGRIKDSHLEKVNAANAEYTAFITPLIMNDPAYFDDVSVASQEELLTVAIWSILQDDPDPNAYEYTRDGRIMIPSKQVEESYHRLFGESAVFKAVTVSSGGIEFKYNKSKDSFIIPITGITPIFSPRITGTKREGDRTILTVDCLSTTAHTVDKYGNDVPPEPSKTVRITLINSPDGSYHISALQAVN